MRGPSNKSGNNRRRNCGMLPWIELCWYCVACIVLVLIEVIIVIDILVSRNKSGTTISTITTTCTLSLCHFAYSCLTWRLNFFVFNADAKTSACVTGAGIAMVQLHKCIITARKLIKQHRLRVRLIVETVTFMWQYVNRTPSINPVVIDNQTVSYNFSVWLGGYKSNDDNARVALSFFKSIQRTSGNNYYSLGQFSP
ncbi:unnamed protein product [Adineta ricciae]|uniref:Uncharacterized protein n=1 Tax=Adineta ricciae TaxID=249248 RepID=A0A815UDU2_ADIRI|nr:unnamed protein product [Adineta ricciae]